MKPCVVKYTWFPGIFEQSKLAVIFMAYIVWLLQRFDPEGTKPFVLAFVLAHDQASINTHIKAKSIIAFKWKENTTFPKSSPLWCIFLGHAAHFNIPVATIASCNIRYVVRSKRFFQNAIMKYFPMVTQIKRFFLR